MVYKINLRSDFPIDDYDTTFDDICEMMDDGFETSKYAAIRVWMEEDEEGHVVIDGEWSTDDDLPSYQFMSEKFDSYDLSSAIGEIRSDFGISFEGNFSIEENETLKTYTDTGEEIS
jgi:hypothetical protein